MLKYIYPQTPTVLSTNLIDEDFAHWDAEQNYQENDIVIHQTSIYRALIANSAKDPTSSLAWIEESKTNSTRWYDGLADTTSEGDGEIVIELDLSGIDAISLFGLQAQSVRLELAYSDQDYDSALVRIETDLISRAEPTNSFKEFVYNEWVYRKTQNFTFLQQANLKGRITILNPLATALVTAVVVGKERTIGYPLKGVKVDFDSYSNKEIDFIQKSALLRIIDANILVDSKKSSAVLKLLEKIEAIPTSWQVWSESEILNIYGYLDYASLDVTGEEHEMASIKLIGLKETK